jgi:hypothetical protein
MAFSTVPGYTPTTSAVTATLLDVYDPTVFNEVVPERAIQLNAFLRSGIMVRDPRVEALARGPGSTGDLPFFTGFAMSEPNYTNDNPAATATAEDINVAKQTYRKAMMHKSWSAMDISAELGTSDPLDAIATYVAQYWSTVTESRIINSAQGVMLDNIANDSGDMVNAIHSESVAGQSADNFIDSDDVVDTVATMGDHASNIQVMAMHSVVKHNLEKQQLITTVRDADNNVDFDVYLGKYRVVVDDSLAPRAGTTDGLVYTTILFATGAFAYGLGAPEVPSEIERIAGAGNGGGQDILHSRQSEIVHPWGFAFDDSGIAGISPTYAELAAAAQWNRVYTNRKNVGMAFITSNG